MEGLVTTMFMQSSYIRNLESLSNQSEHLARMVQGVFERSREAAQTSIGIESAQVERLSSEIADRGRDLETTALRLLLLQQPVAKDLREAHSALEAAVTLKRIGELSLDVLRYADEMEGETYDIQRGDLAELSSAASEMVELACSAYRDRDLERAVRAARLSEAAEFYMGQVRVFVTQAISDGAMDAEDGVSLLVIAKCFEGIAEQAERLARLTNNVVKGEVLA